MEAVSGNQPSLDISDQGRKMFYSPDISLGGNDWSRWPVLYFGTGDRSHPNYVSSYHNRFYVVSDTGATADETYLLNLTCDELDSNADTNQNRILETGGFQTDADLSARNTLYAILNGNQHYPDGTSVCRGWYRVLGLQGECTQGETVNHLGEICVNRPVLFSRVVYFTTFQPNRTSPCTVGGNAFIYALNYSHGTAAFNMNAENSASALADDGMIQDTYQLIENSTIPTAIRVINSPTGASAFAVAGKKFAGAGAEPAAGEGHTTAIPSPPGGIIRLLWDSN
jgi:Tfp pilus tip-associated adhesin PilY1